MEYIFEQIVAKKVSPTKFETLLPQMTGAKRDDWAEIRQKIIESSELNRNSLESIESALFHICLDDTVAVTGGSEEAALNLSKSLCTGNNYRNSFLSYKLYDIINI